MSYIGQAPTSAAFPFDQFSGNGTTTAFTMSYAPASTTSMVVSVSGVVQNPNTYTISGLTLTFSAAPPTGSGNIGVLYLGIPATSIATPGSGRVPFFNYLTVANDIALTSTSKVPFFNYAGASNNISLTV